jgi:hypothetical protein
VSELGLNLGFLFQSGETADCTASMGCDTVTSSHDSCSNIRRYLRLCAPSAYLSKNRIRDLQKRNQIKLLTVIAKAPIERKMTRRLTSVN